VQARAISPPTLLNPRSRTRPLPRCSFSTPITRSTRGGNDALSLLAGVVRWATIKWSSLTAKSTV
jgi:hypothetical protein